MTAGFSSPVQKLFGGQPYLIRDVAPSDAPDVLQLFEEVFGHRTDSRWYAWKYLAGVGNALGLWDALGCLKAHCAGTPRTVSWCGKHVAGLQVGDVMVSTDIRGLLMRKGPFQQVSSRFYASRVGANQRYQLAWGFPNQRHMRLGVKLDLFWDAGMISQLRWAVGQEWLWPWYSVTALSGGEAGFDDQVDAAWASMAADLQNHVLGVRDAAYIRWRFLARPDRQYKLFCLRRRFTGKVLAVIVMRIADGTAELLDIIGPRDAMRSAIRAAIKQCAQAGVSSLSAWASPALVEVVQNTGAEVTQSGASLAIIKESNFSEADVMAARWWWMGGDTDFL